MRASPARPRPARSALLVVSALVGLVLSGASRAADPAEPDPLVLVSPSAFQPQVPYPAALRDALSARDHATAAGLLASFDASKLPGALAADHAFVTAWTLQRAGRGAEAVRLLDVVAKAENAPRAYVDLVTGEILLAADRPVDAIAPLARVSTDGADPTSASPIAVRAQLALADAYQRAERTADARAVLAALADRPDPSPGSSAALWVLAQRSAGAEAAGYLRRLYRYYPGSAEDKAAADRYATPTLEDLAIRGDVLQENKRFDSARDLLDDRLASVGTADAASCRYRYAYGRAQQKLSNLSEAVDVLSVIGRSCKGIDDERAAKALYLVGQSLERKKDAGGAARAYLAIPELYPDHSMADDGYTLGGIQLQVAGDLPGARRVWAEGFAAHPDGDLAAETAWRLAWGAWLDGDVTEAIRWADRCGTEVPIASAPTDVVGCQYWAGRWRAWGVKAHASTITTDPAARTAAADRLAAVATDHPWSFYAVLASARLAVLDPARAAALTRPTMDAADAPWQVRRSFWGSSAVTNALGLVRVGLTADADSELATLDDDGFTGAEMAIVTSLESGGHAEAPGTVPITVDDDFLIAHDVLRAWLKTHPPEVLGANTWKVMRQAYPQVWWPEVQAAATYTWDPRVFHALVREESNFNPKIKSHAGACGLSQLMPATAAGSAKRMGIAFSSSDIWKPEVNLKIGAWYLDTLHRRYSGNSAVALSAYNAGEGNADRWLAAAPDAPTDAYVESITFRETRMYVKRVMSTYQTYRLLYGDGPLYADGRKWVDDAVP